jgi:hypothetical protein
MTDQGRHHCILIGKILIQAANAHPGPLCDCIGVKTRQTIARHNLSSGFNDSIARGFRPALAWLFTGGKGDNLAHASGFLNASMNMSNCSYYDGQSKSETFDMATSPFWAFYHGAYRDDHQTWQNKALHIFGTLSGLALLVASLTIIPIWWSLAFPIVHAAPGLLGHRLFERNPELGDVRFVGGQYPSLWFIAANHVMTFEVLWHVITLRWLRSRHPS